MPKDAGNLVGQKFGRLTVLSLLGHRDAHGNKQWCCMCQCGLHAHKTTSHLRAKHEVSCGCVRKESIAKAAAAAWKVTTKFSHPLKPKIKNLYRNMVKRCTDPDDRRYSDYGGRGIRVCRMWLENRYKFYEWCLENGIQKHLQIDRKENDGPYSPENCKFSTQMEQANNTRKNVFLTWGGKRMTVSQWARELGIRQQALQHRVSRGWSVERIFTQPFRRHNGS